MGGVAYRFTPADEGAILERMRETVQLWREAGGPHDRAVDVEVLMRVGAGAIGCSVFDLRYVEVEWLRARASAWVDAGASVRALDRERAGEVAR